MVTAVYKRGQLMPR